jgi:cytochrome c-type biogenesis protein
VLPLVPVYLAALTGGGIGGAPAARMLARAAAFAAGLTVVFVALGAVASTLGAVLAEHRSTLLWVSGALMLLFGLRSLGLLRIRAMDVDARPALHRLESVSSVAGAFLFGAAFALGWSPCIGPVLASVLTFAATHAHSPWQGAGYLLVYAAGISAPLLLIALGAARATHWLKGVRGAIPRLEKVTGGALVALGAWTLLPLMSSPDVPSLSEARPSGAQVAACDADARPGHLCALPAAPTALQHDSQARVEGAHMLEFTSDECPVCRRMRPVLEKLVASCSELEKRMVRVDVATSYGRALADRFGVRGTPTFILFDEQGVETARLLGETSREDVAAAVERATGLSCWG